MIRFAIDGIMPQRAILRLKRAGIGLYKIKKSEENRLVFYVKEKDRQKVFAIYPDPCYNKSGYSPYTARVIGETGLGKIIKLFKNRIGAVLGALLFCAVTLFADSLVLGVSFPSSSVYAKEAKQILEENGITLFSTYKKGNEDIVCSKILALDGVEFCSVKKRGLWLVVDIRLSDFQRPKRVKGNMSACREGTLLQLTVLQGTPLKKSGERLQAGENLVGGYFLSETGERTDCLAIARASIACAYEELVVAENEEEAFAKAYLGAHLDDGGVISRRVVEKRENCFYVKLEYTFTQSINL